MTKTAKRQLKKNNTKKMKGGGWFSNDAPVNTSDEALLNKSVDDNSMRDKPSEKKTGIINAFKGLLGLNNKPEVEVKTQLTEITADSNNSNNSNLNGGRRRNTKKATRKAKKAGRKAKKGARKANKSRRTRK